MQMDVRNLAGEQVSSIEVDERVFGIEPNMALMHQAVLAILANRRSGTHSTKTRGEVAGSTKKIQKQKGLGRARQGGIRAPHRRHGGIAFGPRPRSYAQDMPKRMRRQALRSALSAKARDGEIVVLEALTIDGPKTKAISVPLKALGATRTALLVTETADLNVKLSASNIEGASYCPADSINTYDVLRCRHIVLTVGAVRRIEALWGGEHVNERRPAKAVAAAEGAEA
jgi:large subunit ribosomal protein L4